MRRLGCVAGREKIALGGMRFEGKQGVIANGVVSRDSTRRRGIQAPISMVFTCPFLNSQFGEHRCQFQVSTRVLLLD